MIMIRIPTGTDNDKNQHFVGITRCLDCASLKQSRYRIYCGEGGFKVSHGVAFSGVDVQCPYYETRIEIGE